VACGRLEVIREALQAVLASSWKRFKPGVEGLLRFHQKRLPQERLHFLTWWGNWRQTWEPLFQVIEGGPTSEPEAFRA
jgi:hypothetical protein